MQLDAAPMMAQLDRILEKPVDNLGKQDTGPAPMPLFQYVGSSGSSRPDGDMVGLGLVVVATLIYFCCRPICRPCAAVHSLCSIRWLARMSWSSAPAAAPSAETPAQPAAANEPLFPPGATQQQVMYPQVLAPAENVAPAATPNAPPAKAADPLVATLQLRFVF